MTFRSAVAVVGPSGQMMHRVTPLDAEQLIINGASVFSERGGRVSAILLSEGQTVRGNSDNLRPGSFGIKRENLEGLTVFSHKHTWGEELAR